MAIQFLNSMYHSAKRGYDDATRKYVTMMPDALIYTTKDTKTLETSLHIVESPKIDFYISNVQQPFHKFSIPKSEARKITVNYCDRDKEIAEILGTLDQFYNSRKNGSSWEYNKRTMKNPNLYSADVNIEDFYKTKYIIENGVDAIAPSYKVAFSDSEVDISNFNEDFPNPKIAPCPIYLLSTIYAWTKDLYAFILYDPRIDSDIRDILNNPDKYVEEYVDENMKKEGFHYHFSVYKTEVDLIKAYFKQTHDLKPDFMGWWNMPFDIPTMIGRLRRAGLSEKEIADIMCDPSIPENLRYIRYTEDPKRKMYDTGNAEDDSDEDDADDEKANKKSKNSQNKPHPSRLVDWFDIPGYTQHYDQLAMFSCLRKRELYPSYKLDDIGEQFAGEKKLDLEDAGYNIKNVNVKNFKICLAYNMRDVFVQYSIEKKQRDINQAVIASSNTRFSKVHSMSIVIKNEIMLYLWDKNQIMGNAIDYDVYESLPGAIVGKPELIEQLGIDVANRPSYVFEDSIDLDASSLYPSLIITFNIFKSALFGHVTSVVIPNPPGSDPYKQEECLGKGEGLFEAIECIDQSIFSVCKEYMNLPTPTEMMKLIEKEATKRAIA